MEPEAARFFWNAKLSTDNCSWMSRIGQLGSLDEQKESCESCWEGFILFVLQAQKEIFVRNLNTKNHRIANRGRFTHLYQWYPQRIPERTGLAMMPTRHELVPNVEYVNIWTSDNKAGPWNNERHLSAWSVDHFCVDPASPMICYHLILPNPRSEDAQSYGHCEIWLSNPSRKFACPLSHRKAKARSPVENGTKFLGRNPRHSMGTHDLLGIAQRYYLMCMSLILCGEHYRRIVW